jgi:hypothetical protein
MSWSTWCWVTTDSLVLFQKTWGYWTNCVSTWIFFLSCWCILLLNPQSPFLSISVIISLHHNNGLIGEADGLCCENSPDQLLTSDCSDITCECCDECCDSNDCYSASRTILLGSTVMVCCSDAAITPFKPKLAATTSSKPKTKKSFVLLLSLSIDLDNRRDG